MPHPIAPPYCPIAQSPYLDLPPRARAALGRGVLHGEALVDEDEVPSGLAHEGVLAHTIESRDDEGVAWEIEGDRVEVMREI